MIQRKLYSLENQIVNRHHFGNREIQRVNVNLGRIPIVLLIMTWEWYLGTNSKSVIDIGPLLVASSILKTAKVLCTVEYPTHSPAQHKWKRCSISGQGAWRSFVCLLLLLPFISNLDLLHTFLLGQSPFWLGFRKTTLWLCLLCLIIFILIPLNWNSMHWQLMGLTGNYGAAMIHCQRPGLISMMPLLQ